MIPAARHGVASRLVALLVLASFWGLFHPASDDACAIGALPAHDEAQQAMGATADAVPTHCAVCHSIRSPRRFDSAAQLPTPLAASVVVDPAGSTPPLPAVRTNVPARAPPDTLS